jgi:nucleoporin NDC1
VYIGERFEGRRKAIFEDIDRKGGSTWSQILEASLEVITGVEKRIADYESPPTNINAAQIPKDNVPNLPRLTQPLKDGFQASGDLFGNPQKSSNKTQNVVDEVGKFAKSHGQSPRSSPRARELLESAESAILTPQQKAAIESQGIVGLFKNTATKILQSSAGVPFRQEYRRKLAAIVLGSPFGDVGIIVDAVDALTRFSVSSLLEDKYGNVQRDVPLIIRTLTSVIMKLEKFKASLGFHWTDIEKKRECPEVDKVLDALKAGLNELVNAFGSGLEIEPE